MASAALAVVLSVACPAAELPDRPWLEAVTLLAHSVRDQTVVIQLGDGERRLLAIGEELRDTYTLRLSRVHDRQVELRVTHPQVSDRQLRLWFDPRAASGRAQIVGSSPDPSETPPQQLHIQPPPGMPVEQPQELQ